MDHPFILLQESPRPNDPMTWAMIGLGAFVLLYLAVLRPMMRGKKDPLARPPSGAGGGGSLSQQRAIERDMQNLLVEYEQMIRHMTAGLDTRAARLEVLIKEADDRLAALKAATADGPGGAGSTHATDATDGLRRATAAPPHSPGPDPRHVEVYDLADQGLSANEVARRLGRPNGEIELILALRGGRE